MNNNSIMDAHLQIGAEVNPSSCMHAHARTLKGFNKCLWYGLQPSFTKETTEIVVTNDLPRVADFKVMTNSSPILFEGAKNSLV